MEYISQLAYIAIVLLIGTLSVVLAYGLKTTDILILLLTGMIFGNIGVLSFENEFIVLVGTLALIFVVFDSSTKFNFRDLQRYFFSAMKLNIIYFILCIVLLTGAFILIMGLEQNFQMLLLALLFSVLAYDTDPTVVLSFFKGSKNKVMEIIEIESVINTPLMVIIGFLILKSLSNVKGLIISNALHPIISFLLSVIVGLIIGAIGGGLIIAIFKKNYFGELSHLVILTSTIITFVGSEIFGGSGVLSVSIFGLMLGNSHIPHIVEIEKFEGILSNSVKIFTYMFLGTVMYIKSEYIIKGTILFVVYILIRFISVAIFARNEKINLKEIIFMTLNVPKGVDVATVLLLIATSYAYINNMNMVINITMLIVIYSIVLSSIASQFSEFFLKRKNVEKI